MKPSDVCGSVDKSFVGVVMDMMSGDPVQVQCVGVEFTGELIDSEARAFCCTRVLVIYDTSLDSAHFSSSLHTSLASSFWKHNYNNCSYSVCPAQYYSAR